MWAYRDAWMVDEDSTDDRLIVAGVMLERCAGIVMLKGVVALRATPGAIICEVIDPMPGAHRCAEEFKVLVENAAHDLARSTLAAHLPRRPLCWSVVEDGGSEAAQVWPAR